MVYFIGFLCEQEPLPLLNLVKVSLCLNVKQFTDNSEISVYSFCFLFIKDFICRRVHSRNSVLLPQAFAE